MSEIAYLFRAVFYITKIARLSIMIGIFTAVERAIMWSIRPLWKKKAEIKPTRLEKVLWVKLGEE